MLLFNIYSVMRLANTVVVHVDIRVGVSAGVCAVSMRGQLCLTLIR